MAKAKYRFLNDGEYETEIELTEEQQSFLKFILDWGFFGENVEVEEIGRVRDLDLPERISCPACGRELSRRGITDEGEAEFWCDHCQYEIMVDGEVI